MRTDLQPGQAFEIASLDGSQVAARIWSGSYYSGLQASLSLAASYTLTLPATAGTSGQVLGTSGSGTLVWTDLPSGALTSLVTGTTVLTNESIVLVDSATNCSIFLPAGTANRVFRLRNLAAGTVTIYPDGTETIEGAASFVVLTVNAFDLAFYGTNWYLL